MTFYKFDFLCQRSLVLICAENFGVFVPNIRYHAEFVPEVDLGLQLNEIVKFFIVKAAGFPGTGVYWA